MSPEQQTVERERLERLIFQRAPLRRYTQDSPILPDVWFEYGEHPMDRVDLLLGPYRSVNPGDLYLRVRDRLEANRGTPRWTELHGEGEGVDLAYSQSTVAARLWFDELVRVVLPLADWPADYEDFIEELGEGEARTQLAKDLQELERGGGRLGRRANLAWMIRIVGTIELARRNELPPEKEEGDKDGIVTASHAELLVETVAELLRGVPVPPSHAEPLVYSVSRNREASVNVFRSVPAMKADAAWRLFNLSCADLQWAVIDSGIDARHPAFRLRDPAGNLRKQPFLDDEGQPANNTRIVATYDFTRIRDLLNPDADFPGEPDAKLKARLGGAEPADVLRRHLLSGRQLDWDIIAPLLEVKHQEKEGGEGYRSPGHEHGTHVASILGGDWRVGDADPPQLEDDLTGVCPDIRMYDIRVLEDDGTGNEFSIIAALQFIRHLNANQDAVVVHGVNLSLSIPHDVANYACGRTPVCEECERLVSTGMIVVTAAGNEGYIQYATAAGKMAEGYRNISITDPGNADGVITVGATHRYRPHTYGVSYFSSRGPTGDGRMKPDLVAPGEKIWAAVPDEGVKTLDGTSMATPHVSGAAAMLLARHRELLGQPDRVKEILCGTATDLGRERYFQGNGMVDVLRAIQSV
jgi:serine protease AprX